MLPKASGLSLIPQLAEMYDEPLAVIPPTDMLTKVDCAAMSVGLETRLPFLDPAVLEFAWRLPIKYKIRDGQGRWLVQQLLHRFVPKSMVDRPKTGFESPVSRWLRGPPRDWAESLLNEPVLRGPGYFRVDTVWKAWAEHLAAREDHPGNLWTLRSFQAWLNEHLHQQDSHA
jgi:asparagine synthase (glutamine-hydrolysing)